jgi:WD40 repeat protein/TPR repeat protein
MKLDQQTWALVFPWLDKAQDVPAADLPAWIDRIVEQQPEIGIPLREVLAQTPLSDDDEFLEVPLHAPQDRQSQAGQPVGAYTIDTLLAEGGMGEVWLAHRSDGQFEGRFAVKLLHLDTPGAKALDRFKREGRLLARLTHPHIARLIDAGATRDGQPFLVLEYIDGEHIDRYCQARALSTRSRVRLFQDVLAAVAHAHTSLIIHRDIKPSNVLVTAGGIVKLLDFGIAKLIDPESTLEERGQLTRIEEVALTPSYAAPEQILGEPLSTATDVYQLGVLLHVLLAGCLPPGKGDSTRLERVKAAMEDTPVRISDAVSGPLRKELKGDLDAIIEKSLRTRPQERYATAAALSADLQRYLEHEPVTARSGLFAYKTGKFVRRHRFATAFVGMVTILSVLASAAALIAVKQKRAAEHQTAETLKAQARLLTQAAAQRLKNDDLAGAQGIILAVLTGSELAQSPSPAAISVFQEIRAADAQLAVLSGHGDPVASAHYSPDGTRIVTASFDATARIWDARTGAQLAVLGQGDSRHAGLYSAAYSPDGTHIVTASDDRTARLWDVRTGSQLAVLSGHGDRIRSAAYSPDGTHIVTASADKTARIWDGRTGAQLAVLSGHGAAVLAAAYSPDGMRIVTASMDKTARIWDAKTGAQLAVLSGHDGLVLSAAYSPDGMRIVTASADATARIWDSRTGAQLAVLSGHGDAFYSARYSPDGARIVTASQDKTARIWDAGTGAQLAVLSGHADIVLSADYSPDGGRIVTGSEDKTARVWDARTGAELAMLSGHSEPLNSAAYSPDGTRIVSTSQDKTARVWDARKGAQLGVLSGHAGFVLSAAYSADGTRIVTASADKTARVWDAETGVELAVLSGHGAAVESAAYSPDGTRIVTASDDKTARIWDAHVPASIAAQILWDEAAQTDPLPELDRIEFGLLPDAWVKQWGTEASACDQAAGAFYDPERLARGLAQAAIVADVANAACFRQIAASGNTPRLTYQAARALLAKSEVMGARQLLERAVAAGYRAAQVDLANLLMDASAGRLDPARAVALDQKAWQDGVPIAACLLGHFFETGVTGSTPDLTRAWEWYKKGADAGEPHAVARFAERAERQALTESDPEKTARLRLQAFSDYAAAAERAHDQDWPDEVWRDWRYRRATLARILASQGMMQQVADAYAEVLARTRK